ncbi:hypothetical protein ACIQ9R_36080 [Streptomyces sp. NPDC094447]|uniref:hypothetical protein n=1 Tax=Streptomyces sp. NPDC094447 TaxID=3366062 RepID=UPI00380B1C76
MPSSSAFGSLARVLGSAVAHALAFPLVHLVWVLFSVPPLHDWPWYFAAGFLAGASVGLALEQKHTRLSPLGTGWLALMASVLLSAYVALWASALFATAQLAIWIARRRRMLSQCDPTRRRMRDWASYSGGTR